MSFSIDTTTYQLQSGYTRRPNGRMPTSIIIHTTSGNVGSSFSGEAKYLLKNDRNVSAHYLVGKVGQIAQLISPEFAVNHSGYTFAEYLNSRSIGIENHHAKTEAWTTEQHAALTWLVRHLMGRFHIARNRIETHRAVALYEDGSLGRKQDPNDWDDEAFYAWRNNLVPYDLTTMIVRRSGVRIHDGPGTVFPIVGRLDTDAIVTVDAVIAGETIDGESDWAQLADGGFATMRFLQHTS